MMKNDDSAADLAALNPPLVTKFEPDDYSDVGQGTMLARAFRHCLCYCDGIGWLTYKDGVWSESEIEARGYSQKLTTLQLQEAMTRQADSGSLRKSKDDRDGYFNYACLRRASAKISAALKEAVPMLNIESEVLDGDPLILNTPSGEVNLRTGEMCPHDPEHYITHMTSVSPTDDGAETWEKFLTQITCGEEVVAEFLQQLAGMAAIGKVYEERLIIAVGSGGNGKSTYFNTIQEVLGDYAGTIRSELMISSNDSGKKFEFARLRGKRFIIAEELSESKQLDTGAVKQLCSTGDINAQFKGKDVFTFKPSHSTVLCTNHMPAVKTVDDGTWDRLIVIPFNGRFRNQGTEIKNYGAYLVENCGGAILSWIIEGAKKYIQNNYKLIVPDEIQAAINGYKAENDWALDFFQDSLVFGPQHSAMGSELYDAYEKYCGRAGITAKSQSVVMQRIQQHPDVTRNRAAKGMKYKGVGVDKPESLRILQEMNRKRRVEECMEDSWFIADIGVVS